LFLGEYYILALELIGGREVGKVLISYFVYSFSDFFRFRVGRTDQHVCGGQRCDEVVARLPDGPVHDKRYQHQYVAGDGEHHAHADDQHDDDLLPGLERRQHRRQVCVCHHRCGPVGARSRRAAGRAVVDGRCDRSVDDSLIHLRTNAVSHKYHGYLSITYLYNMVV